MNRLKEHYKNTVIPNLQKQFNYKNVHQVPKLDKIVVSMGVGAATQNKAILDNAVKDMEQITGRKPIYRDWETDRKSTRLNSSHITRSRMPSSA